MQYQVRWAERESEKYDQKKSEWSGAEREVAERERSGERAESAAHGRSNLLFEWSSLYNLW